MVGRALVTSLIESGADVVVLSRHPDQAATRLPSGAHVTGWTGDQVDDAWARELEGADAVVNLAGASIGGRPWTPGRKREILQSRVTATEAIVEAIARLAPDARPLALVNASGIDVYGDRGDEPVPEETLPGDSFLAEVCAKWEAAACRAERLGTRVVVVRTAFVVAADAPALRLLALPFRLFLGGPLGGGRQWFSWIHIGDLVAMYRLAIDNAQVRGPLNAAAPGPRRQSEVAREIGQVLRRPSWLPAPKWLLRLLLRGQADLLIHGRRAEPLKALEAGFEFRHTDLSEALADALG